MKKLKIAVTGSRGYVGSCIARYLEKQGYDVHQLTSSVKTASRKTIPFSLKKDISPAVFKNIDVLVHCAWDFRLVGWKEIQKINVTGSLQLFEAARKGGVKKIIFISSMSAFEKCKSKYGKSKLQVEKEGKRFGIIIIRPGLVYDTQPAGMVGALGSLMDISPVIPIVGGEQMLYLCHSADLARLVEKVAITNVKSSGPITSASEHGYTFKEILRKFAAGKGKKVWFLPVPYLAALLPLKVLEFVGIKTRLKSDSLVSLVNQNPKPDFSETSKIGVGFRDFK